MAKHIIWGVLNWGLGHATRSAPLIEAALRMNCRVTLASDGAALQWLQKEFPMLPVLPLPSYGIKQYNTRYSLLPTLSMLPNIYKAAHAEKRCLYRYVKQHAADAIFSDNRLGFYHRELPSFYMSHQLHIPAGRWQGAASWLHGRYYRHFQELLVPDVAEAVLAGNMAQNPGTGKPLHFIGWPSRLRKCENQGEEITVILSGPEPQRSRWEKQLLQQLGALNLSVNVVGGTQPICRKATTIHRYPVLNTEELQRLFNRTKLIISRCGYTTLLDVAVTGKKALLIPTPGQWEQQYLAQSLNEKGWLYTVQEHKMHLNEDIKKAMDKPAVPANVETDFKSVFADWLRAAVILQEPL